MPFDLQAETGERRLELVARHRKEVFAHLDRAFGLPSEPCVLDDQAVAARVLGGDGEILDPVRPTVVATSTTPSSSCLHDPPSPGASARFRVGAPVSIDELRHLEGIAQRGFQVLPKPLLDFLLELTNPLAPDAEPLGDLAQGRRLLAEEPVPVDVDVATGQGLGELFEPLPQQHPEFLGLRLVIGALPGVGAHEVHVRSITPSVSLPHRRIQRRLAGG